MSAEYAAERFAEAIAAVLGDAHVGSTVDEDLRSDGYFFDVTFKGHQYEVLVVEFNGDES